jgi:single-strand DNA-binding protein
MNTCVLTGHLGADPEVVFTPDGVQIANFSVAFRSGKDKTSWLRVTCFERQAELAEKHLHKGAKIGVNGYLDQDKWVGSDGHNKTAYKLVARQIEFLKTDGRGFEQGKGPDDEIPF